MLIQKQYQQYFRTKIKKIISYFCVHYLYYNLFALLFALFQYNRIPFAIPLGLSIAFEILVCYYYSNKQMVKMVDHVLHIMAYNFVIILYYTNLQYFIFGNLFLLLSFVILKYYTNQHFYFIRFGCIRTKESCSSQITHEYSSIIRFLKTFYRFSALVASVCISLKLSKYVEWTWPQAFWWYWMFLSALVGIAQQSSNFIILVLLQQLYLYQKLQMKSSSNIRQFLKNINLSFGLYIFQLQAAFFQQCGLLTLSISQAQIYQSKLVKYYFIHLSLLIQLFFVQLPNCYGILQQTFAFIQYNHNRLKLNLHKGNYLLVSLVNKNNTKEGIQFIKYFQKNYHLPFSDKQLNKIQFYNHKR